MQQEGQNKVYVIGICDASNNAVSQTTSETESVTTETTVESVPE